MHHRQSFPRAAVCGARDRRVVVALASRRTIRSVQGEQQKLLLIFVDYRVRVRYGMIHTLWLVPALPLPLPLPLA